MHSRVGAVVCALAGHRWGLAEGAETHAGMTVIRCSRCAGESIVSSETFEAEGWLERSARRNLAE